jgi:Nitrile hydratase, alpha chain
MTQQAQSRKQIEASLIAKAQAEPAFRKALLNNPKAAIEKEFGVALPAGSELKVVEETASTNYLVLPAIAVGDLSDADLENVAGGWYGAFYGMSRAQANIEKKEADTQNAIIQKIG